MSDPVQWHQHRRSRLRRIGSARPARRVGRWGGWLVLGWLGGTLAERCLPAAELRVPSQYASIQQAVDQAESGDTVLVEPGRYCERLVLRPGVVVRSAGDEEGGTLGLKRAELTILDGEDEATDQPGVRMAAGSCLDGFTVTRMGRYEETRWQQQAQAQGEAVDDDEGAMAAEGVVPAIAIRDIACRVLHCVVHHNGDVGLGIVGSAATVDCQILKNVVYRNMGGGIGVADGARPLISGNLAFENLRAGIGCRNAAPTISDNCCRANLRAGIGCRERACPILRANYCSENLRAGIGIRMPGTAPLVLGNTCLGNAMAGIGCRDQASPILRRNRCERNEWAGIGCSSGAEPWISDNRCEGNLKAGIGLEDRVKAWIENNHCVDNRLVAIGVTSQSQADIVGNHLRRSSGIAPLIAVQGKSSAVVVDNECLAGGVAAILVEGTARIRGNRFRAIDEGAGLGIWVKPHSSATISENEFHGYRSAIQVVEGRVMITRNQFHRIRHLPIRIKDARPAPYLADNQIYAAEPEGPWLQLDGLDGVSENNRWQAPGGGLPP